jgi:nitroreductase
VTSLRADARPDTDATDAATETQPPTGDAAVRQAEQAEPQNGRPDTELTAAEPAEQADPKDGRPDTELTAAEPADLLAELETTWRDRRSIRAFRPEPLERATILRMFAAAQAAPSWCNVQPWRAVVTMPPATGRLAEALVAAAKSGFPSAEVPFPLDYPQPYKDHRQACGVALYQAMGIARDDKARRYDAWLRNYALFDAPHVAVVACDRRLGPYAFVDVGVWLGYVLTAAAALGIATCPMASVAAYPQALRAHLPLAETDVALFGIAFGHADNGAPANACRTAREPVEANITLVDALLDRRG